MAKAQRKQTRPIGPLIKAERESRGWSQRELAARIGEGMTREYLAQIEGGSPKWPQIYIASIAQALDLSDDVLARYAGMIGSGDRGDSGELRESLMELVMQLDERDLDDAIRSLSRLVAARQVTRTPTRLPR